jgi:hypothetical protein
VATFTFDFFDVGSLSEVSGSCALRVSIGPEA